MVVREFTDTERLFFEQVQQDALNDNNIRQAALAHSLEKFSLGVRPQLPRPVIERMASNDDLVHPMAQRHRLRRDRLRWARDRDLRCPRLSADAG